MTDLFDETPLERELASLKARRTDLCKKRANADNHTRQFVEAEITAVNNDIKELNLKVNERREARCLWLSARHILDDEKFDEFRRTARMHRMGILDL